MAEQLRFYSSLTKEAEPFLPPAGGTMRRFLFADFLRRTLEFSGLAVREVMNITDVGHLTEDDIDAGEDKLEAAAREASTSPQDIARQQTQLFLEDIAALNIQPAWK